VFRSATLHSLDKKKTEPKMPSAAAVQSGGVHIICEKKQYYPAGRRKQVHSSPPPPYFQQGLNPCCYELLQKHLFCLSSSKYSHLQTLVIEDSIGLSPQGLLLLKS
jgi:hypothetical protein